jgi:hypothetical protein
MLIAVFFTALTALLFEITLSRILAILLWHHFAFLIISCALLGYGAAGVWLYLFKFPADPFIPVLLLTILLFPLVILVNRLPFDPALVSLNPAHALYLVAMFMILAIPFFLAGLTLVLILKRYPADSFRIYGFDMLGAACGCIGFFGLIHISGETIWLLVNTCCAAGASMLLCRSVKQCWLPIVTPVFLLLLSYHSQLPRLTISDYKSLSLALRMPNSRLLHTQWDAVSRVDWFESSLARFAPGLSLYYQGELPPQIGITIDGDRLTGHTTIPESGNAYLENLPSQFLLQVDPVPENVLILDVVGGDDINQALRTTNARITVQTDNGILENWLKAQFAGKGIEFRTEKARSLLETATHRFDRIVVSLEGALPTGGTGMSSLVESSLETREGMATLLDRLSMHGWLSFHRYVLPPPRAELRLMLTIIDSMNRKGWNPKKQLAVLQTVSTILVVVHAQAWTTDQVAHFQSFCREKGFTPLYYPGIPPELISQPVALILENSEQLISESPFDLTPVNDNRPFFHHFLRIDKLGVLYQVFDGKWEALVEAGLLLPLLWCLVWVVSLLFLLMPLALKSGTIVKPVAISLYFLCLGFGFMSIEIAFFEKLVTFLGYPTYSLSIVLGTLLVSSGSGAMIFRHRRKNVKEALFMILIGILLLYFFGLDFILTQAVGLVLPLRILVATSLILLPGLVMGVPFPHGIDLLSARPDAQQRIFQAWCFNSFASVLGSVSAMLIAVFFGISVLFLIASLTYTLAIFILKRGTSINI